MCDGGLGEDKPSPLLWTRFACRFTHIYGKAYLYHIYKIETPLA